PLRRAALARCGRPTERDGLPFGAKLDKSFLSSSSDKGLVPQKQLHRETHPWNCAIGKRD
ncbi:MAG: hypothetical protein NTX50_13230, partial [Candidatus Sumerlaeota bacterium]|nr:hypothetical protein [Candidatus Sumerlaeota bacterium]